MWLSQQSTSSAKCSKMCSIEVKVKVKSEINASFKRQKSVLQVFYGEGNTLLLFLHTMHFGEQH